VILARAAALFVCLTAALSGVAGAETAAPPPSTPISWDRAANIKESAERIGLIQRTRGAEAAIKHIDACYRTHGLASAYSAAFEGCIAQDYLQTKLLTRIYGRLKPHELRKMGAPTADQMAQAMGRRVVAAFSQYKVSAAEADAYKSEVDKVGLPVFLKTVFPNSAAEIDTLGENSNETGKSKEKN
jgi:hypothetical protein